MPWNGDRFRERERSIETARLLVVVGAGSGSRIRYMKNSGIH